MKNLFYLFSLTMVFAISSLSFTNPTETKTVEVDTKASEVIWKGYKVTGSHDGTIKVKSGSLEFTEGALSGGSFEIDMNSITCTDLKGGGAAKLVGHLKSDDFFGVATYPTAKFVIKKAIPRGPEGSYKIVGDLTIKETTKEIKFNTQLTEEDGIKKASADITIDRSDYDVKYGSGTFFGNLGNKTIYDEFELAISLVMSK